MSEKKYIVPEGMRLAVAHAVFNECGRVDYHPQIRVALEAAVCWLSENPIVPSIEDLCEFGSPEMKELPYLEQWREASVRWQRRMFVAPEPHSFYTPFGRFIVDDRVPPGEIRLENWNGPTVMKVSTEAKKEEKVSEKKIVVPEGMLKAAQLAAFEIDCDPMEFMNQALKAALGWIADHPIPFTVEMRDELYRAFKSSNGTGEFEWSAFLFKEFQRRMLFAPEPEVPEEIKDLLWDDELPETDNPTGLHNTLILAAYIRGTQKAGK